MLGAAGALESAEPGKHLSQVQPDRFADRVAHSSFTWLGGRRTRQLLTAGSPAPRWHCSRLKDHEMPDVRFTPLAVSLLHLPEQRLSELRILCRSAYTLSLLFEVEIEVGECGEQRL
jgi:hypothetical protein